MAVRYHLQNWRFCLIYKVGGFVSFTKSAVLSHLQNWRFCIISKLAVLSHFKIGGFVSLLKLKSAVLSHLEVAVLSCSLCYSMRSRFYECTEVI